MAEVAPAQGLSKTPADFLKSIKGKPVIVKLNSGVDYRGARRRAAAELDGSTAARACVPAICKSEPRRSG